MIDRQKIIEKLEKEVKRTYAIKTAIYHGNEKVKEEITGHREPFVSLTIEMAYKILALLKEQKAHKNTFTVIDKNTGEYPNVESIARRCKWAQNLIYCDIDEFVISEDGILMLTDDCGNVAICPSDRFEVVWDD